MTTPTQSAIIFAAQSVAAARRRAAACRREFDGDPGAFAEWDTALDAAIDHLVTVVEASTADDEVRVSDIDRLCDLFFRAGSTGAARLRWELLDEANLLRAKVGRAAEAQRAVAEVLATHPELRRQVVSAALGGPLQAHELTGETIARRRDKEGKDGDD